MLGYIQPLPKPLLHTLISTPVVKLLECFVVIYTVCLTRINDITAGRLIQVIFTYPTPWFVSFTGTHLCWRQCSMQAMIRITLVFCSIIRQHHQAKMPVMHKITRMLGVFACQYQAKNSGTNHHNGLVYTNLSQNLCCPYLPYRFKHILYKGFSQLPFWWAVIVVKGE